MALYIAHYNKQEISNILLHLQSHKSISIFTSMLVYYIFILPTSKTLFQSSLYFFKTSFASQWFWSLKAL